MAKLNAVSERAAAIKILLQRWLIKQEAKQKAALSVLKNLPLPSKPKK